jgi:hypothetical protein
VGADRTGRQADPLAGARHEEVRVIGEEECQAAGQEGGHRKGGDATESRGLHRYAVPTDEREGDGLAREQQGEAQGPEAGMLAPRAVEGLGQVDVAMVGGAAPEAHASAAEEPTA